MLELLGQKNLLVSCKELFQVRGPGKEVILL